MSKFKKVNSRIPEILDYSKIILWAFFSVSHKPTATITSTVNTTTTATPTTTNITTTKVIIRVGIFFSKISKSNLVFQIFAYSLIFTYKIN